MEPLALIFKKLTFSQKKAFLIFPKMEPCTFEPKIEKLKNPSNGNPEKIPYISGINFPSSK